MADDKTAERLAILETQMAHFGRQLEETREALNSASRQVLTLQRTLDALLNQGRGMRLLVSILATVGGLGWLVGIVSFFQQQMGK